MQVYRAPQVSYEALFEGARAVVGSCEEIKVRDVELSNSIGRLIINAATISTSSLDNQKKTHIAVSEFGSAHKTVPDAHLLTVIKEFTYPSSGSEHTTINFATLYVNEKKGAVLGGQRTTVATDSIDIIRLQLSAFYRVYNFLHKSYQEPSTDRHGSELIAGIKRFLSDMPAFKLQGNPAPPKAQKLSDPRLKENLKTA